MAGDDTENELLSQDYLADKARHVREQAAESLWLEYYIRTESFDREVCTGPEGLDGILPATMEERRLIERNAKLVLAWVRGEADQMGLAEEELIDARKRLVRSRIKLGDPKRLKQLLAERRVLGGKRRTR